MVDLQVEFHTVENDGRIIPIVLLFIFIDSPSIFG